MADPGPIAEKTDEELAREARAGSRRSFDELARRYKRRLFVYLRPRVGSDQDAEDLVQETFLKLYRNIGSYEPAFKFSTWLYTAAGRLAIDAYRRGESGRAVREAARDVDVPDPAGGPEDATGVSELWRTARTLGGDRYRVLWLRYGEDLSVEEIAAVLGRTKLAVRVLLHRARTCLAGRLGPGPSPAARAAADAPGAGD